jgi:signal transduction histidine kinase
MNVKVRVSKTVPCLVPEQELALMRILQEALWNAYRHSGSASATVQLRKQDGEVHLVVADQGRGMNQEIAKEGPAAPAAGLGLHGMRERLRHLGGRLEFRTGSQGTTVIAVLPMPKE